jgi:hypothetical protein
MKIFKELNKLGYKHYTENTVEELDDLPLDSEERIMEQALVLRWFREKYGIGSWIHHYFDMDKGTFIYSYVLTLPHRGEEYVYDTHEEAELACLIKLIELVKKK